MNLNWQSKALVSAVSGAVKNMDPATDQDTKTSLLDLQGRVDHHRELVLLFNEGRGNYQMLLGMLGALEQEWATYELREVS